MWGVIWIYCVMGRCEYECGLGWYRWFGSKYGVVWVYDCFGEVV